MAQFELHGAGRLDDDHFYREYALSTGGMRFVIREELRDDLFAHTRGVDSAAADGADGSADGGGGGVASGASAQHAGTARMVHGTTPSLGDIMDPRITSLTLPLDFTPLQVHRRPRVPHVPTPPRASVLARKKVCSTLTSPYFPQRVLLTANGNVGRIVSSYYAAPVTAYVAANHRRKQCVYDRQVHPTVESRVASCRCCALVGDLQSATCRLRCCSTASSSSTRRQPSSSQTQVDLRAAPAPRPCTRSRPRPRTFPLRATCRPVSASLCDTWHHPLRDTWHHPLRDTLHHPSRDTWHHPPP